LANANIAQVESLLEQCKGPMDNIKVLVLSNLAYFYCGDGDFSKAIQYNSRVGEYIQHNHNLIMTNPSLMWNFKIVEYISDPGYPFLTPDLAREFFSKNMRQDMPQEWKEQLSDCDNITIENVADKIHFYSSIFHHVNGTLKKNMGQAASKVFELMRDSMVIGMTISLYTHANAIYFR